MCGKYLKELCKIKNEKYNKHCMIGENSMVRIELMAELFCPIILIIHFIQYHVVCT